MKKSKRKPVDGGKSIPSKGGGGVGGGGGGGMKL